MQKGPNNSFETISAAILAGGLGTRLRSVVSDKPKVLATVKDRPFLARVLDFLDRFGVKHVVLCTGYMGQEVERVFGNRYAGLSIDYSLESRPLGTGGALRHAFPLFKSDRILVLNGDSCCEVDLDAFDSAHTRRRARASLVLAWTEDTRRFGRVSLDSHSQVTAFHEKKAATGSGWINAGIYLFEGELIAQLPRDSILSLERDVFPMWIPQGIFGFKASGGFFDIGTPESFALANQVPFQEHLAIG